MSLTSLIRTDRELRERLAGALRPAKRPRMTQPIKVPAQTRAYALTGTAFDYLLRFSLQRRFPEAQSGPWVADWGAEVLGPEAKAYMATLHGHHQAFLRGELPLERLAALTTILAKFDSVYRSGEVDPNLSHPVADVVPELLALAEQIDFALFEGERPLLLNPNFGPVGAAIGGADADLIVGGRLIDVKTTMKAQQSLDELRQLLGYVLLAEHGVYLEGRRLEVSPLTHVGLYYSRYGVLAEYDLGELVDAQAFGELRSWFSETYL